MSKEKEEALRQINEIKNHLVDKQTFFPYDFRATYIWSIIAIIMTLFMVPVYEMSVLEGAIISCVLIGIGFLIEGSMIQKVNESYDIEESTHKQQFIMKSFVIISFFMIVLSSIFASYKLYVPMLLTWLFIVSLGYFFVGFLLNIQSFSQMASFNMVISIVLLIIGYINNDIEGVSGIYLNIVQFFLILGLSIIPAFIGWKQIKEEK